jgi:hypothetical protein
MEPALCNKGGTTVSSLTYILRINIECSNSKFIIGVLTTSIVDEGTDSM